MKKEPTINYLQGLVDQSLVKTNRRTQISLFFAFPFHQRWKGDKNQLKLEKIFELFLYFLRIVMRQKSLSGFTSISSP